MKWLIDEGFVMVPKWAAGAFAPVLRRAVTEARRSPTTPREQLSALNEVVEAMERLAETSSGDGSATSTATVPIQKPERTYLQGCSTEQAASRLGISDRAVRKALVERRLEGTKRGGRWVIDLASIEEIENGHPDESTAAA